MPGFRGAGRPGGSGPVRAHVSERQVVLRALLDLVEGGIRGCQQFPRLRRAERRCRADADRHADPRDLAADVHRFRDSFDQSPGVASQPLPVARVGGDYRKLVSAKSCDVIRTPAEPAQANCDFAQHRITRGVTEFVVDRLEPVQVQQEQRDVALVAPKRVQGALQFFLETHPVGQAGQRIPAHQAGELALGDQPAEDRAGAVPAGLYVGVEIEKHEAREHRRERVVPAEGADRQCGQNEGPRDDRYPGPAGHARGRLPAADADRDTGRQQLHAAVAEQEGGQQDGAENDRHHDREDAVEPLPLNRPWRRRGNVAVSSPIGEEDAEPDDHHHGRRHDVGRRPRRRSAPPDGRRQQRDTGRRRRHLRQRRVEHVHEL